MHAHVPVDLDTWCRGWYLKGTVCYILRAVYTDILVRYDLALGLFSHHSFNCVR